MSAKPAASFHNAQFDQSLMYHPLYMPSHHEDLHKSAHAHEVAPADPCAAGAPDHASSFFSRPGLTDQVHDGGGTAGLSFAERFKRWTFDQERTAIASSDLQGFNMSPLLTVNNEPANLFSRASTADGAVNGGGAAASEVINAGGNVDLLVSLGSSASIVGNGMQQHVNSFLPLSNSCNTPYPEAAYANSTAGKPDYSTAHADMEILKVNQAHSTASGSVHLFEDIPSPLTHQSVGFSAASHYNIPYPSSTATPGALSTSSFNNVNHAVNHHSPLFPHTHHHQWVPSLRASSGGNHPHAELLLLPGVTESAVEASQSPATTHNAAFSGSNKLEFLHVSSLHDKHVPNVLSMQNIAAGGSSRLSTPTQMWHIDKLQMPAGLGLHDNPARATGTLSDFHHYSESARHGTQSGLSLFLQSPQQRAQTALSLETSRYSSRSASGSLGVLRNSRYLKPAQQVLNEFCSVYKESSNVYNTDAKESSNMEELKSVAPCNFWNAGAGGGGNSDGVEKIKGPGGDDHGQLSRASFFSTTSDTDKSNVHQLTSKVSGSCDINQLEKRVSAAPAPEEAAAAVPAKQLPADERCHLQMRKARLVAMVEELDRRYQQYRDHMQLIVTSFESATGLGGAAPYTTLARRAMSKQFRGLRDAIGEHISAVCRMLGEELSSVPILSRGETPRLRLVDQRLRHQRSLQQIGMLPQQQAWRPQRGLPERSVSVLRAWLFEHFLHPYPKDSEKAMLARLTGLSRNQVSNWFINARVRLWKPMIEEMYVEESKALEMQQQNTCHGGSLAVPEDAGASDFDISNNSGSHGGDMFPIAEAEGRQHDYRNEVREDGAMVSATRMQVLNWAQQVAAAHYNNNTQNSAASVNDLDSFINFHSSTARALPTSFMGLSPAAAASISSSALSLQDPMVSAQAALSWMKPNVQSAAANDFGSILAHNHSYHHAHHDQVQQQDYQQVGRHDSTLFSSSATPAAATSSDFIKSGVSLTLGLQQPPIPPATHYSTYHMSSTAAPPHPASYGMHAGPPSEALLF